MSSENNISVNVKWRKFDLKKYLAVDTYTKINIYREVILLKPYDP